MNSFDVIVIGGGHAGIEAAWVCARRGLQTALISLDIKKIGLMSCNPAIGGLAKGQLVREIDALGGLMGRIIDESGIHFKMLNTSKGPAVQSPRAQADRGYYAVVAQKFLNNSANLHLLEGMVSGLGVRNGKVTSVLLNDGSEIKARAVILTAGTFLNGIIHVGLNHLPAGRAGDLPARGLSETLMNYGFRTGRLKTGTPPRIHRDSIDYSKTEEQKPDNPPRPFSFSTDRINRQQISCYITYTNPHTHDILREGFDESPMFTGRIQGVGPRYCPSIEDKIDRFADKSRHQIFLEPEGYTNPEVYVNGFSTSLPGPIQERAIRTVSGLEKCRIIRLGYAVEYDFFPPDQLYATLETKAIEHLYFAGQVNGTSGYEEAAAQGFLAGLNAALKLQSEEPFALKRSEAYIGVLIDDLINKIHEEPYRMFTSRAEFRLLLRQDNADLRLMDHGYRLGLVDDHSYDRLQRKREEIKKIRDAHLQEIISPATFNEKITHSAPLTQSQPVEKLLRRPEVNLVDLLRLKGAPEYSRDAVLDVEFSVKYKGYLDRQQALLEKFVKTEGVRIPEALDYNVIKALSAEAREKLNRIRPANLGQAARISGVSPSDISVLMVYLEKYRRMGVPRETI
ncbi:MAG: tRNA uridine-5-carboxymethylaminomethyl(34) synthesis enzyme MnmG [Calditrichaeota bacterium]|nr:MAG: tRNA uridine-5-carboxymethylaminomethyl(34) synthesis enzyme MnmG [Calditrichota bacterium]